MMPDHSSRAETQRPTALLQAPAHINIITSYPELGIEAAYRPQARGTKSHVTAWNVFGLLVGKQNMDGTTRGVGNTIGDESVARRSKVGSTYSRVCRRQKSGCKIGQPMAVRTGVIINIGNNLTCGSCQTGVASLAQTAIFSLDDVEAIFGGNGRLLIGRSIVDDDNLEVRIVQLHQTCETIVQGALPVVTTHDHGDAGIGQAWREWHCAVCFTYSSQGQLRLSRTTRNAEIPIPDV